MKTSSFSSIRSWIGRSINIYVKRENLFYLTKFAILQLLAGGALYVLFFAFGASGYFGSEDSWPVIFLTSFLFLVLNFGLYIAQVKAVAQVVEGGKLGVSATLQAAIGRIIPYLLAALAMGFLVILGLALFIIPGIILFVWFYFVQFFVVVENKGPIASLKASRNLVKGKFWPLAARIIIVALSALLARFIIFVFFYRFIGSILVTLLSPYFALTTYLLYAEAIKKSGVTKEDKLEENVSHVE